MIFQIATKEIEIIKATYEMIIVLVSILPLSDMSDSVTTQWSSRRTRGFFLKRQMQSTPFAPLTPSRPSFGRRAKGLAWSTYRAMLWQGLTSRDFVSSSSSRCDMLRFEMDAEGDVPLTSEGRCDFQLAFSCRQTTARRARRHAHFPRAICCHS